ncbi:peptidoglycan editing factor PgeF [bacterium]|nr:peptidoglycan editing factor PgeF [bacterium]
MLLHNSPLFKIYFGDAKDNLDPEQYLDLPSDKNIFSISAFVHLKNVMKLDRVVFLKQTHSNQGEVITSKRHAKGIRSFTIEGDYLITNVPCVGLGVMTADCLPIVLYDSFNQVVAAVHAGWRGSAKTVVLKALSRMEKEFGTKATNIRAFFGPSAKVCCYTVGDDMLEKLEDFEFIDRVVQQRGKENYFDLPVFNKLLLQSVGVKSDEIKMQYNLCTMCDKSLHSHRRDGKKAGRQMTVVSLQ